MRIRAGKLHRKLAIAISLTLFGVRCLHADDITYTDISVAANETKTIDADTYCKSLSVSGKLIVKAKLILNETYNGSYVFAPDSSDNAIIELKERGGIAGCDGKNNPTYGEQCYNVIIKLGDGHGKVIVDTSTTDINNKSGLCTFVIPATATDDSGIIDFIEFRSGINRFAGIENNSKIPVGVKITNNSVRMGISRWEGVIFRGIGPFIFENTAADGQIVYSNLDWYPFYWSKNSGTITVKSDLVIDHADSSCPYTSFQPRLILKSAINWTDGANLFASNTIVRAEGENVLPYGANGGNVYSWTWKGNKGEFTQNEKNNIMPYQGAIVLSADQCVNGIIGLGEEGGYVYNEKSDIEPTITLGTDDIAGVLKNLKMSTGKEAWTTGSGPINVKKVGNKDLIIEKSNLGKNLSVYDGSVVVDGREISTVPGKISLPAYKSLTVKEGSTLNTTAISGIDYVKVPANDYQNSTEPNDIEYDACSYYSMQLKDSNGQSYTKDIKDLITDYGSVQDSADVVVESGATLVLDVAEAAVSENVALNVAGTLEKNGAGIHAFKEGTHSVSGNIKVNEGTLAFRGMGITDKYWRWTITKTGFSWSDKLYGPLPLKARFTLRDKDGNNLTSGMTIDTTAKSATELEPKRFMIDNFDQLTVLGQDDNEPYVNHLFGTEWHNVDGKITAKEGATIESLVITFRLATDATAATQYSFSTYTGDNWPDTWTMESSPDGENWRLVDSRENQSIVARARWGQETSWYAWWTDNRWGNFKGLPFTFNYANEPASGGTNVEGAKVEVGARASLDLTGTTGNIAALTIDCANGAGTVTALRCAEQGALYLKNVASLSLGSPIMATPNAVNGNIRYWKVYFDGVAKNNYKAVIKNDAVTIIPSGTRIIIK